LGPKGAFSGDRGARTLGDGLWQPAAILRQLQASANVMGAGGGAHINCWGWKSLLFGLVLSAVMVCGGKVAANVLLTMADASLAGPRGSAMMLAALGGETPKTFRV